jgi:predicted RNA binding protein with dsRBD fold (UPF0201 family)
MRNELDHTQDLLRQLLASPGLIILLSNTDQQRLATMYEAMVRRRIRNAARFEVISKALNDHAA